MPKPSPWWNPSRHQDRRGFLLARNAIRQAIAAYFIEKGFIEVEPGCLQVSPGNETHLHAFATTAIGADLSRRELYLHTSPEFACKKLLAAGEQKIFAFAPVFRNRERGRLHSPEFTMLEWYRAGSSHTDCYSAIQADCAEIAALALSAAATTHLTHKGRRTGLSCGPQRIPVPEAFQALFGIDLAATIGQTGAPDEAALIKAAANAGYQFGDESGWADVFSHLMAELERTYETIPGMTTPTGEERLLVLDLYPACMSPLASPARQGDYKAFANAQPDAGASVSPGAPDSKFAKRFEVFASGVELANGFGEANDPARVRAALEAEMADRQIRYGERYPIDDDFIDALSMMPDGTSGCALGFDRLVMLATGAPHIDLVRWTPWPIADQ